MTRNEILQAYDVDSDGRIRSPGKFEGEMLYAPYFYDAMLNGGSDESGSTKEGTPDVFQVTEDDRKEFPELSGTVRVELYENEQGFVSLREFTQEEDTTRAIEASKWDCYEFNVAGHYASAIINDDWSGLDERDSDLLCEFLDTAIPAGIPKGHWDGFAESDSQGFSTCDVSGLKADCYTVRYHFRKG